MKNLFNRAIKTISGNLDRQIKKTYNYRSEKSQILERINKVIGIEKIPVDIELVIEAIYEE